jgi:hypothetical protein
MCTASALDLFKYFLAFWQHACELCTSIEMAFIDLMSCMSTAAIYIVDEVRNLLTTEAVPTSKLTSGKVTCVSIYMHLWRDTFWLLN